MRNTLIAMRSTLIALALVATTAPAFAAAAAEGSRYDDVLGHYETVRTALVADRWNDTATTAAQKLRAEVAALAGAPSAQAAAVPAAELAKMKELLPELARASEALATARDLKSARDAFYGVSKPLVRWHAATGRTAHVVSYCSMAKRSWLQPASAPIGNPYYGQQMATCGEKVK